MTTMARVVRLRYGTIRRFAAEIGVSSGQASLICQGRTLAVMTPDEVRKIAGALDRSFADTVGLLETSYCEWSGQSISEMSLGVYLEVGR